MNKLIIIDAELTNPPTHPLSIRTLIIYALNFLESEVIFALPKDQKDVYWKWLKKNYLLDFSKNSILIGEAVTAQSLICSCDKVWAEWEQAEWNKILEVQYINTNNLNHILTRI